MNITIDKEVLEQVLEALNSYHGYMEPLTTIFGGPRVPAERSTTSKVEQAITAIREALAEQPAQQQEPVVTRFPMKLTCTRCGAVDEGFLDVEFEAPPAIKPWVGLTDEEIISTYNEACRECFNGLERVRYHTRAIEAKLREKNTGEKK